MIQRRNVIAAVICAVMLLSIFVFSAYIVHETALGHECTGEDCPICLFIAQIEQVCRGFGALLAALLLMYFSRTAGHGMTARANAEGAPALCTLVGRKIRLND